MARGHTFRPVETIGRTLPDVELTTTWGQPALEVRGKMAVCLASRKAAEPPFVNNSGFVSGVEAAQAVSWWRLDRGGKK